MDSLSRRLSRCKRGLATRIVPLFIYIIVSFLFVLVPLAWFGGVAQGDLDRSQADSLELEVALLYSPQGLGYIDTEIDRLYPNIIDLSHLDTNRLSSTFSNERAWAKVEFTDLHSFEKTVAYVNQEKFEESLSSFSGEEKRFHVVKRLVTTTEGDPGLLRIEILS